MTMEESQALGRVWLVGEARGRAEEGLPREAILVITNVGYSFDKWDLRGNMKISLNVFHWNMN